MLYKENNFSEFTNKKEKIIRKLLEVHQKCYEYL